MNRPRPAAYPGPRNPEGTEPRRNPRLVIAGEFSAGKTKLISGLLGEALLPSNVTSTALPPVWLVPGTGTYRAVDRAGHAHEISGPEALDVETMRYGIMAHGAPILQITDIIDTPGNSDPNIPAEVWRQMIGYADAVVWCTNATQAWRQSEKSVWLEMPEVLRKSATLLITHADRIGNPRSAERVLRRVRREAGEFFAHFMLVSLVNPSDIARIEAHLRQVVTGLDRHPGADNPLLASLSAEFRHSGQPRLSPRRPRPASAGKPAPKAEASPSLQPARPAPRKSEGPQGRARALWAQLGGGRPDEPAAVLLARVERLIETLDAAPRGRTRNDPPEELDLSSLFAPDETDDHADPAPGAASFPPLTLTSKSR